MERYKVIVQQIALKDLQEIYYHISVHLNEPAVAERLHQSIVHTISGLDTLPLRHKLIDDEPYHSQGYRIIRMKNYLIFYIVDEPEAVVHVVRILYTRRDWQNLI